MVNWRVAFGLFILAISIASVSASIGVSPGYYNIDFEPNLKANLYFDFSEDNSLPLEIYAEGDLADYVKLSTTKLKEGGSVAVALSLPERIDIPGTHVIYIGARQVSGDSQRMGIVGSIKGAIRVIVPYPGQYATVSVAATNANVGEAINVTTEINNLGDESVDADANVKIYNSEKYITEIDLGNFFLDSPEKKTFESTLHSTNYPAGIYTANATLNYGNGNIASSQTTFRLGELAIRITNHSNFLERNKINRFDVDVASDWNGRIDDVYANITLEGYPVSFLTPTTSIDNFGTARISGFFDTTGIVNDTFNARIKVHYAGKSTEQVVTLKFADKADYMLLGMISAVIVVALLVIIVTYMIRKNGKRKK